MDQYIQDTQSFKSQEATYTSTHAGNETPIARIIIPTNKLYRNNPSLLFPNKSKLCGTIMFVKAGSAGSYFRFLETNIQSLFLDMKVLYGGVVIQDIKNYAQLCHLIDDASKSYSERQNDDIEYLALRKVIDNTAITAITTYDAGLGDYETDIFTQSAINNDLFNASFLGCNPTSASHCFNFCISLKSLFGDASSEVIPLHLFNKNDITLEFTLNNNNNIHTAQAIGNRISSYTLFNFRYEAFISNIPLSISKLLYPNNQCNILFNNYSNEVKPIANNSNSINETFYSFKYQNLKNIFFFFRNQASRNSAIKFYTGQRLKANLRNFYLTYNHKDYPKNRVRTNIDMFNQVLKAFHSKGILSHQVYITNADAFLTASDAIVNPAPNPPEYTCYKKFIGCINLTKYNPKDNNLDMMNGLNSMNEDIILRGEFQTENLSAYPPTYTPTTITEALELVVYSNYTSILEINDGDIKIII